MNQDATCFGGRLRPRPHYARWGPSSLQKRGHNPQFSIHVCCGQTAGWIKMPLGTMVGLGQGNIVWCRPISTLPKGHSPPIVDPCLLWSNCWMDQDVAWYKGRSRHRPHCVTWGPSSPKGAFVRSLLWAGVQPTLDPRAETVSRSNALARQQKGQSPRILGPSLLWPNGHLSAEHLLFFDTSKVVRWQAFQKSDFCYIELNEKWGTTRTIRWLQHTVATYVFLCGFYRATQLS